jgi:signal transduction histidine kinase/ligand-binding sensor domain-containing protein
LIVFLFLFDNNAYAFGNTLDGKTKFAGTPSGIIRDIEVVKESTFIASENGVFHLLGGRSESINFNQTKINGTVSDLSLGLNGNLWIVEYGVGVFSYDLESGVATQQFTNEKWPKYAWKIQELEGSLVVSLIQGVIVADLRTGKIQGWADEIGVGKVYKAFSISAQNNVTAYVSSEEHLLKIDVAGRTVDRLPVDTVFPELASINTVSISKEFMFVGGREGLYIHNFKTETKSFFPFEKASKSAYAMSDVYLSSNNDVYVAAGGLFELKGDTLKEPNFMAPLLSSEEIKSITRIRETQSKELLLASSQLGLISLSSTHQSINLVHAGDTVFRSNIQEFGINEHSDFIVKTRKGNLVLDKETGALTAPLNHEDTVCIDAKAYVMNSIHSKKGLSNDYCELEYIRQFHVDENSFFSYSDNGETAVFELIRDGEIIDHFPAPQKMKHTFLSQSGEIVGFDVHNSVHIQMSKFRWKSISPNDGGWSSVSCLIEGETVFLVCTSGQGIRSIDKKTGEIKSFKKFENEDLRFIRAGVLSSKRNLWVSTNKGLYVLSSQGEVFSFSESDGIYDTDFEYGGMRQVGEKILLMGDNYSYLIDESSALEAIAKKAKRKKEVIFSKFSWVNKNGVTKTFHPQFAENSSTVVLDNDFVELNVDFVTSSYSDSEKEKLEFRIVGIDDTWKPHPRSQAYLSISDIKHGKYTIQSRILGEGNPTNSLSFTVRKPFYLLNEAYCVYLTLLAAVIWGFRKRLIQDKWARFKSTNLYTNLTRFEITDGQSKFEKMLRSKERQISEITHELRTPIQVIKGSLEKASEESTETKEFISIKENMRRVEQLIEQMRSDIPRATNPSDYYRVYTLEDIRFIVNSLEPLAKQKRQNLEVRLRGKRDISLINDSLEKIISNLVQNAIKYTQEHGNITVSASIDSKVLKVSVSDDGEGIDERIQGKVFERFVRGETKEEGQGIGLSIVRNLTELNQGNIELDSTRGVGSKFIVILPVDDIEFVNSHAEELQIRGFQPNQKSLLIVDDSREFRTHLFDLLSPNYRCLVAGNGEQALDVMQRFLVDLVITDQLDNMPATLIFLF